MKTVSARMSPKKSKLQPKNKSEQKQESRRKKIGLEFMKFIPKKLKTKKHRRRVRAKPHKSPQMSDDNYFSHPREDEKETDRSLHIEFEPNLENGQLNLIPHIEEIPSQAERIEIASRNF